MKNHYLLVVHHQIAQLLVILDWESQMWRVRNFQLFVRTLLKNGKFNIIYIIFIKIKKCFYKCLEIYVF